MNLYRDNANHPTKRPEPIASALPLPSVIPDPDTTPWSFRSRDDFPELMNRWGLTGVGVEVGTYRGGFATHILKNWPGLLYVVDPWTFQPDKRDLLNTADIGSNEAICRRELWPWVQEGRCEIHKGFSVEVAQATTRRDLDWIYIDALHDYDSVTSDLNAWAPLIRSGGALCGHDYLQHPSGSDTVTDFQVIAAVTDWRERNGYPDPPMVTPDDGFASFVIRLR